MSIILIIVIAIAGFVLLQYFSGMFYISQANSNPVAWRIQMANKIRRDTIRDCKRYGLNVEAAHKKAINHYYKIILDSGNPTMYQLFMEMTQDEFPKQLVMFYKKIYGESYQSEYARVKNKEELLEIVESERQASGGISNFEKMCIDNVLPSLPSMEDEEEILESIPSILVGINEMGLPTTFEEVRIYLSERLGNKQLTSTVKNNASEEDNDHHSYAKEIQKHLRDLGCAFTTAGYVSAMALKHDRSALDQAISFCVGAIAENYSKNLIQLMLDGHTHLTKTGDKIKNYYENGQISKPAYQSVISTLGSCLNPNKTDEEKAVLESLIKQNYLGDEILVSISG